MNKLTNLCDIFKTQSKTGGNLIFDEEGFENNVNLGDMNIELSDKMEELKKETVTKESSDNMEIKYHGMQIPIKSEKVKSHFIKIDEVTQKVEKEPELNKKITMFSEISNNIDEIIKSVKRENIDETTNKSESNYFNFIFIYFYYSIINFCLLVLTINKYVSQ